MKKSFKILALIITLGGLIRLAYALRSGSLLGDELRTVHFMRAGPPWEGFIGLLYYLLLHCWVSVSESALWLRLFSWLFGVITIAVMYFLGKELLGEKVGIFLSLITALSPVAIYDSVYVRFYSLYFFLAAVSLWLYLRWLEKKTAAYFFLWLLTSAAMVSTHLFGVYLVYLELVYLFVSNKSRLAKGFGWFLAAFPLIAFLSFFLFPQTVRWVWGFVKAVSPTTGLLVPRSVSRSFTPLMLSKWILLYYYYLFGYASYPLYPWMIPLVAGAIFFSLSGLRLLLKQYKEKAKLILSAIFYLPVLFLGFDVFAPPEFIDFEYRFGLCLLPMYLMLYCVHAVNKKSFMKNAAIFFIAAVSLLGTFTEFREKKLDWSKVFNFLPEASSGQSPPTIVYDYRTYSGLKRYLPPQFLVNARYIYKYSPGRTPPKKIFLVFNDWRKKIIDVCNNILVRNFDGNYNHKLRYFLYPATVYELTLSPRERNANLVPARFMPIEFQDLSLPLSVSLKGHRYPIENCLTFKPYKPPFHTRLSLQVPAKHIILVSTFSGSRKPNHGDSLGQIRLMKENFPVATLPIRYGIETYSWRQNTKNFQVAAVYSWHKKFAFIGTWGYDEKYNDFQANLYASVIPLENVVECDALEVSFFYNTGKLHVWGLFLE